jgi:hypothetical protein
MKQQKPQMVPNFASESRKNKQTQDGPPSKHESRSDFEFDPVYGATAQQIQPGQPPEHNAFACVDPVSNDLYQEIKWDNWNDELPDGASFNHSQRPMNGYVLGDGEGENKGRGGLRQSALADFNYTKKQDDGFRYVDANQSAEKVAVWGNTTPRGKES